MKLVAPLLATLLLVACAHTPKNPAGRGFFQHSKTNTVFNVAPPSDAAQPTTQSFRDLKSNSTVVIAYATNETVTTKTNGEVVRKVETVPVFKTNEVYHLLSADANISPPRVDTTKALTASYEAMRPLQYVGIACLALGVIGGAIIAFVFKWPTLGLKLGGSVSALGVILLVLHKVLATVSPYVFLLIGLLVVVGIVALVLDHLHVFKSGQLHVHEDGK